MLYVNDMKVRILLCAAIKNYLFLLRVFLLLVSTVVLKHFICGPCSQVLFSSGSITKIQ